ncbi:hypothetical protein BFN03_17730 [Rhodococcus sp. WMMA185]|nr:hypothetical protein BFN03_17730 [Rhodococcus sp. WMMA185]
MQGTRKNVVFAIDGALVPDAIQNAGSGACTGAEFVDHVGLNRTRCRRRHQLFQPVHRKHLVGAALGDITARRRRIDGYD